MTIRTFFAFVLLATVALSACEIDTGDLPHCNGAGIDTCGGGRMCLEGRCQNLCGDDEECEADGCCQRTQTGAHACAPAEYCE